MYNKEYQREWERKNKKRRQEYMRKWREDNKDKLQGQNRRWETKNPEKYLFGQARRRANRLKLPFNIDVTDIIIPEFCPVLGIKLRRGDRKQRDTAPSLDKIYPNKGYVKGNVRVISWLANSLKQDITDPEIFLKVAIYVKANQERELCPAI